MMFKNIEIRPQDIKCVIPWNSRVLLSPLKRYADLVTDKDASFQKFFICIDNVEPTDMTRFKFEHIKYVKTLPDPEDRVADFECRDEFGLVDWDARDKLVDSRKTRKERQAEIEEAMEWIGEYEEHGLDCDFLKEDLKRKIRGGY